MKWVGGDFFEDKTQKAQTKLTKTLVSSPAAFVCCRGGGAGTVGAQLHGFFFFSPGNPPGRAVGCGTQQADFPNPGGIRAGGGGRGDAPQFSSGSPEGPSSGRQNLRLQADYQRCAHPGAPRRPPFLRLPLRSGLDRVG